MNLSAQFPSISTNCYTCDNYVFEKSSISLETTDGKIKFCCKLCFEKFTIAVQQREFRTRRIKPEKKEKG